MREWKEKMSARWRAFWNSMLAFRTIVDRCFSLLSGNGIYPIIIRFSAEIDRCHRTWNQQYVSRIRIRIRIIFEANDARMQRVRLLRRRSLAFLVPSAV